MEKYLLQLSAEGLFIYSQLKLLKVMKNLLVFYWASGKLNVEKMSASEVILLNTYIDVDKDRITIINTL